MSHCNSRQTLLTSKGMIEEPAIVFSHIISAQLQGTDARLLKSTIFLSALTFKDQFNQYTLSPQDFAKIAIICKFIFLYACIHQATGGYCEPKV